MRKLYNSKPWWGQKRMQHLTHQSSLTAKPNLCLIKEISFILSFSTTKKKSKIAVIAETLFQQHCNCSDHRETSFSPVTRLTYHLIRNKSTAPQMVIIYELLIWCDQITVKSLLMNKGTILFPSYFLFPKFCHKQTVHKFFKGQWPLLRPGI